MIKFLEPVAAARAIEVKFYVLFQARPIVKRQKYAQKLTGAFVRGRYCCVCGRQNRLDYFRGNDISKLHSRISNSEH